MLTMLEINAAKIDVEIGFKICGSLNKSFTLCFILVAIIA